MYMPNMELHVVIHCLPLLLVLLAVDAFESNSNVTDSSRTPRSSRRVVRLYSGTRPAPLVCLGEGFQADPVNCAVFYRCMKSGRGRFMSFKFQCAPGTIYDPQTEVCNHPSTVKRSGCGLEHTVSVSDQINDNGQQIPENVLEEVRQELPSPISTKHPFYTEISNALPSVTSSKQQDISTAYPWITSTNDNNRFSTVPTKLSSVQTTNGIFTQPSISPTKKHRTTTPRAFSDTRQPSVQTGDLCQSEGFMGDSENCRKFYRCISNLRGGFIRYEFMCTESTIWDDDIQSCNHAWAVKRRRCGRGSVNDGTDEQKNINQPQNNTTHRISTSQDQQTNNGLFVSQTQKSSSYVTQSQSKTTITKTTMKSNPTTISPMDMKQTQNAMSSTDKRATSEDDDVDDGYNNINMEPSEKPNSNECFQSGFMGDENDCKKFYRCVDNGRGSYTKFEFSCGDGTVWDANLEACNHAWAVKECGGKASTEIDGTTTTFRTDTSTRSTPVYVTTTTATTKQSQPTLEDNDDVGYGNQHQNPTTISTTTQSSSSSSSQVTKQPENSCTYSGFMGDENDCKIFYRCVDNGDGSFTRYEFTCGEGTVWDANLEACNHAWAVKECGVKGSTQSTETPTAPGSTLTSALSTQSTQNYVTASQITTDNDENIGYGNQNQESSSAVSTTASASSSNAIEITKQPGNNCNASGFMGDKNDCKKFYRCVDNGDGFYTRYEFSCGEGTVWDSDIEACNHPWAVPRCGGSSLNTTETYKPTTTVTEGTTYITQNDDLDSGYGIHHDETPSQIDTSTSTTTKIPSQSDGFSTNCTSSGFTGDQYDCKKFYRCVDNGNGGFTRYEFTCGEGTVWDPEIEACNHAWAVEKCSGSLSNEINKEEGTSSSGTAVSSSPATLTSDENEIDTGYGQSTSQSTILSSSASSSDNEVQTSDKCTSNGFIGDKNNCKKFYRCVDNGNGGYTRYEFTCGEGTVWDPQTQACNHEWAVQHCEGNSVNKEEVTTVRDLSTGLTSSQPISETTTTPTTTQKPSNYTCTSSGFMGDNKNCKKFYRCVDNGNEGYIKYEFTCGDGTVWNQEIQACDHDNGHSCSASGDTSVSKQPENDEMYLDNNSTTEPSTSESSTTEHTSETQTSNQNSAICQTEGFYGDPNDCKKFYRCVDNGQSSFTKYDFTCGDGTVWDQEIQACDHESNSKCRKSSTGSELDTKPTSSPVTTSTALYTNASTTASSTTDQPSQASQTEDTCTSEGFHANSVDCRKFYRCVDNGKGGYDKYDFSCGEGTMWVQEIQACDHQDEDSNCSNSAVIKPQSEDQQSTTEHQLSSSSSTTVTSAMSSETTLRPNDEYQDNQSNIQEDDICSSEGYYPNKNDCRKFYRCVDNGQGSYTRYDFSCGEGTAWDTDVQTCNHISEVSRCRSGSHDDGQNKPMQDESVSQTTEGSSTTEKTITSSSSSKPSNKDTCESEGYFGNTKDCTKFYRCVDNGNGGYTKYDFDCGEGTIWDQDVQTCNHPQDVVSPSCSQSNEQSETSSSSTSTTQSSSTTIENSSQSSSNCSQENTTKKPANQNITCEKAGYYSNPNDCKKFYRCVDWDGNGERFSVYHFECGEGTIWDPQLDTCNHEESVYPPRDCSGVQSQTENVAENSSEGTSTSQQTTESTTESSTTTEQTTSHETTTEQSTTTEGNTSQQSTTTDSTTVQQSTTTETTTTQQTTTTESTTTQQSTTSEETTTSTTTESTTKEDTTSQQSTTESTTTQQTTEGTTTQQSTTESTTTQQTTEGTTTQKSTTESTTTQQTTDATTTQSTTESTTENTTTEQSTTENTTTEQSTIENTTTEQTTEGTSAQQSTTDSTTTLQSTTEGTTTQQPEETTSQESTTTESTTTQQTTTTEGTTSTTEESSTQQSTTSQTDNTESTTTEESADNQSTTESMSTTDSTSSSKECPDTDDDQYLYVCPTSFRRHPKYCNMFYQCTEDDDSHEPKIAVFTCPNNTIYDETKTQCVEENKAEKKCDGQIAQRRRVKRLNTYYKEPIVVGREKFSCSSIGYYPFEKTNECSPAFLKCQKAKSGQLRGYVHLCPEGYLYWSISKRCERKGSLKDCKSSTNDWSRRWEIPVEHKNVAL